MTGLPEGSPLPPFALTTAVSGITVDNAWLTGRKCVIVVHGSKTTDVAKEVSKALRAKEPDAKKVAYVSIVDLRPFSGLWKKVAEAQIKSNYAKLADKAKDVGLDPLEHVIICPDWDAAVCAALGFPEPDKQPGAIIVDAAGNVLGSVSGTGLAPQVLAMLG